MQGGRFVLTIKYQRSEDKLFEARFVVLGHVGSEKELLVHASTTIGPHSFNILTLLETMVSYNLWCEDMTLAYVQEADRTYRKLYVKWKSYFQIIHNQISQLRWLLVCQFPYTP